MQILVSLLVLCNGVLIALHADRKISDEDYQTAIAPFLVPVWLSPSMQ